MKDLRQDYRKNQLLEEYLADNPFTQFEHWFEQATQEGVIEPNACILSTVSERGADSRTILLKGIENKRFVFYTNYLSNKGKQLSNESGCSLAFLWLTQERQIIVRGTAERQSAEASDEYFESRPRESKIGAWSSSQSLEISSRQSLENQLKEQTECFEGSEVHRPPHWGGYEITPYEVEFWQGRPSRLHDRIVYYKEGSEWKTKRLQP